MSEVKTTPLDSVLFISHSQHKLLGRGKHDILESIFRGKNPKTYQLLHIKHVGTRSDASEKTYRKHISGQSHVQAALLTLHSGMERERTLRARGRPAPEVSHLTAPVSAPSNLQTHSSHKCRRSANHFNAVIGKKVSSRESEQPLKQLKLFSPITCALTEYLRSS